ncbi:trichoplein keratin filament-binding protein isoform X2 [Phoenix dactylifera]|uniref:Trichoplein keratin filament-binding protein isoform X2 n=1 Tax=Phoenix dactylifera TaxID=42345 RepID=A0A8B7CBX9_PHODC|nr:trichoplein keratin filament-binding protein isoform X2 [Phoenix dactylifera]
MSLFPFSTSIWRNSQRDWLSYEHYHLTLNQKQRFLVSLKAQRKINCRPLVIRSALKKLQSDVSNGDNGATEPAGVLLERLFAKRQKLEEMMSRDSNLSDDAELNMNLEILESDIQAALSALRMKEEDLQDAERRVLVEQTKLNLTKQDLERREEEITTVFDKQLQMEEDLKKANGDLASQARQIEDLKLLVEEQGEKIASLQVSLSQKEDVLEKLENELMMKNEEARILSSAIDSKEQLLYEANEVIREQETKIEALQQDIKEKEHDLAESLKMRKADEERTKVLEATLEKQTVEWLKAQKELKELTEQASQNINDMEESFEEFQRVRSLLAAVRSELISSQEFLASSRRKMEDQAFQFEKQVAEINEQKFLVMSYSENLKVAQIKVENKRSELRVAHARCKELETQLSVEKENIERLQEDLSRERASLEQKTQKVALLQNELREKEMEYSDIQNLLQVKESELVEASLQIQHLKSEKAHVQAILQEKDNDYFNAQKKLAEVNHDIAELQRLINSKEEQLIQTTTRLQEKEEKIQIMQHDLDNTKLKYSEATSIVQRIAQLTNKLVVSVKDEEGCISAPVDEGSLLGDVGHDASFGKQKQLETELEMVKKSLRQKEMDFLAAQKALTIKEQEFRAALKRLDMQEKELKTMKERLRGDADGLMKLYSLAQERIGGRSVGDLAIERLQVEVAQLEAEAATTALQKLADMTCQLLKDPDPNMDIGTVMLPAEGVGSSAYSYGRIKGLEEAEKEVAHLFALTEQLVNEARISVTEQQH